MVCCAVCIDSGGAPSRISIPHWPINDFSSRILWRICRSKPRSSLSFHVLSLRVFRHLISSFCSPRSRHLAKVRHFRTPCCHFFFICRYAPRNANIGRIMTLGTLSILWSMGRISWLSFDCNLIQMSRGRLLSAWSLAGRLLLVLLKWHVLGGRRGMGLVGRLLLEI